jgi:translocation and assembly module TamB
MSHSRRFLIVLLTLLIVAGILWWLARIYLSSPHIATQVASRLQEAYGAPVQLGEANIGLRGSTLHKVQLFEPSDSSAKEPWLVIEHAEADIPLWDLIKNGALPSQLTLTGVAITLRFDEAGQLLTHLPTSGQNIESLPGVKIDGGQLTIQQEGRPDFTVTGIQTDAQEQNKQLALTGTVADPTWGDWTISGALDRTTSAGSTTVKTADLHFTQSMLERLPFVPAKIWQQVQVNGDTAIDCAVRNDWAAKSMHYEIVLEPRAAKVSVPAIELSADQGQGKIIAQDGVITVADVQGRAAGGEVKAAGKLDFAHTSSQLDLKVDASNLELDKLPKNWELPPFGGQLSGHADLQITLVDGKMRTNGSGQGAITGVRIPGAPESKPIRLTLHPTGEGFRFRSQAAESDMGPKKGTVPLSSRGRSPFSEPALLTVALLPAQAPADPPQAPVFSPVELVNFLGTAVLRRVDALTRAGTDLVARLPKQRTAPPKPQESPSYLEAQLGLDNVDVAQLVQGLHIPLPFAVAGRISFSVQLAIPVNTARDLKSYRLRGTVTSPRFTLAGQELENIRARVVYADGVLRLEELSGQIPPEARAGAGSAAAGLFEGTARLQVIPQGDLTAHLALERIPFERVLSFMPKAAGQAQGAFSGNVEVRAPAAKLKEIDAWQTSGAITTKHLQLYGLTLEDTTVPLQLRQGTALIEAAHGRLAGTPLTISAELRLANAYPFTGHLDLQKADLAALEHLAPEVRLPVSIGGQLEVVAGIKGTLKPFAFQTTGNGTANDLTIDQLKIGTLRFRWQGDADRIQVTDVRAHLYGGELSGSGVLPLRASVPGDLHAQIQNLDVGALSKDMPNMPVQLDGCATGRLEGTLRAAEAAPSPYPLPSGVGEEGRVRGLRPREFTSRLELQAPQLRVQGIPTEGIRGSVDYRNEALTYHLEGETLGGKFHLDGQVPPAKPKPAEPAPEGHLRIEGVRLGRLAEVLHTGTALGSLRGIVNLDVSFRHAGPHLEPVGGGRFTLDRLNWGATELAGSLHGDILVREGEFRLRNLTGEFARGLLRAQIVVNLRQLNRSWFTLALDQVEAARLLAPWPALAGRVEAPLQVHLRGTLGREWRGSGEIAVVRGWVAGVEIVDWSLPLGWAFVPGFGSGQVDIRESTGQLALGRVVSRASLTWGIGLRVEGQVRFFGVELRTLVRQVTELSQLGSGQVSGRFDFAGDEVRSVDDLTGTLDARLQQTQALQLPVLQQIAPFLSVGQSSAAIFQAGSLRGHLAHGVFRIDQLSFTGTLLQLFVNGTVSLQERLNLEVMANTGNLGVNPAFVRFLGLRLPAVGPIPLTLLLEASTYFSNRLVHLRVTGTVRSPVITVEALSLLTEEALRFFVNRSNLPVP